MDITDDENAIKTNGSSSSFVTAVLHKDVPIEVQVLSADNGCEDAGNVEPMSTTSSDSDIGTAESCSPIEFSKESIKTILCNSNEKVNDNKNNNGLQTKASEASEAELFMFNGFEDDIDGVIETPPIATTINRSPSIQGNYSPSAASDLEPQVDPPESIGNDNVVVGPNMDRIITKQYSPSLNRISDELQRLQQTPVDENPWEFLQSDATFSTATGRRRPASYVPRNRALHSTYSVGIQVNNPEMGYFIHRNTQCDWIRCMMCAVIVACIITGLCAATVMILNTFFQYWLLP